MSSICHISHSYSSKDLQLQNECIFNLSYNLTSVPYSRILLSNNSSRTTWAIAPRAISPPTHSARGACITPMLGCPQRADGRKCTTYLFTLGSSEQGIHCNLHTLFLRRSHLFAGWIWSSMGAHDGVEELV